MSEYLISDPSKFFEVCQQDLELCRDMVEAWCGLGMGISLQRSSRSIEVSTKVLPELAELTQVFLPPNHFKTWGHLKMEYINALSGVETLNQPQMLRFEQRYRGSRVLWEWSLRLNWYTFNVTLKDMLFSYHSYDFLQLILRKEWNFEPLIAYSHKTVSENDQVWSKLPAILYNSEGIELLPLLHHSFKDLTDSDTYLIMDLKRSDVVKTFEVSWILVKRPEIILSDKIKREFWLPGIEFIVKKFP